MCVYVYVYVCSKQARLLLSNPSRPNGHPLPSNLLLPLIRKKGEIYIMKMEKQWEKEMTSQMEEIIIWNIEWKI